MKLTDVLIERMMEKRASAWGEISGMVKQGLKSDKAINALKNLAINNPVTSYLVGTTALTYGSLKAYDSMRKQKFNGIVKFLQQRDMKKYLESQGFDTTDLYMG
jgi:hypothetical protein